MGHKAEYLLPADEIPERAGEEETTTGDNESKVPLSPASQVEMEQIRLVVEKALDSRLKPLTNTLARAMEKKGPGFTEIIGGIGYIFGIMGLILYFKSREKR